MKRIRSAILVATAMVLAAGCQPYLQPELSAPAEPVDPAQSNAGNAGPEGPGAAATALRAVAAALSAAGIPEDEAAAISAQVAQDPGVAAASEDARDALPAVVEAGIAAVAAVGPADRLAAIDAVVSGVVEGVSAADPGSSFEAGEGLTAAAGGRDRHTPRTRLAGKISARAVRSIGRVFASLPSYETVQLIATATKSATAALVRAYERFPAGPRAAREALAHAAARLARATSKEAHAMSASVDATMLLRTIARATVDGLKSSALFSGSPSDLQEALSLLYAGAFAGALLAELDMDEQDILSPTEALRLFLDEAEALLAKRQDARDASDRYANARLAYLLRRIRQNEQLRQSLRTLRAALLADLRLRVAELLLDRNVGDEQSAHAPELAVTVTDGQVDHVAPRRIVGPDGVLYRGAVVRRRRVTVGTTLTIDTGLTTDKDESGASTDIEELTFSYRVYEPGTGLGGILDSPATDETPPYVVPETDGSNDTEVQFTPETVGSHLFVVEVDDGTSVVSVAFRLIAVIEAAPYGDSTAGRPILQAPEALRRARRWWLHSRQLRLRRWAAD